MDVISSTDRYQAVSTTNATPVRECFDFSGNGAEYFRIWIVNLMLTILTLGIYSAWAKVRRNRYIYGNISLADHRLDYIASPLVILRGRLIALGLLVVVVLSEAFFPPLWIGSGLALSLLAPWLLVRSRMFNMRYTVYRNIRFGFRPAYLSAYKVIYLYGILSVLSLGLFVPYAHFGRNELIVGNTRYGALEFHLASVPGKFYRAYLQGVLLSLLFVTPLFFIDWPRVNPLADAEPGLSAFVYGLIPMIVIVLFLYTVAKYVAALLLRATTNNTTITDSSDSSQSFREHSHQLGCDWSLSGMLWIYVTNTLMIVLTLGLFLPWAQMRILKYQLEHTWVDVSGDLGAVIAGQAQHVSSIGEEIGDVFDIDVGL